MQYHLEYLTIAGQWLRVASYSTMDAAIAACACSAVFCNHKRITRN